MATTGIGSGLDVNSIVSQLMAVESRPLTVLAKKEASYQAKLSAFGSVRGALSSFQTALKTLSTPDRFQSVIATPADATIFTGSASSKAVAGNYAIDVTQLAKAQTLSTSGKTSSTATIGEGLKTTLTFQFGAISGGKLSGGKYETDPSADPPGPVFTQDGDRATGTVVIDSSNNSLQGIRDAINKAGIGVTASIISDGSASPNHLVITSDKTGAASSMKITVSGENGADPDPALSELLSYDPAGTQQMTQSSAALDTKLTVNGIAISSPTTTVSEAIQGVTMSILKTGSSSLKVARDTDVIKTNVNNFVKAYNELSKTIKGLTSYDTDTKRGGLLLGDSATRAISTQIKGMLTAQMSDGNLGNLMQLGVTFQKDGTLAVDSGKLDKAIANNFDDVAGLFAAMGTATDSLVSYTSATATTKPGTRSLYISALATQGSLTGSHPPADLRIVDGENNELTLNVDGISATIKLPAKTYTAATLASAMQSAINGSSELSSKDVAVSVSVNSEGKLSIVSDRYGSASKVSVTGTGALNLFGDKPAAKEGNDVAGTIGGMPAEGSGQVLTGARGSAADGLKLTIAGGAIGERGKISYSLGMAHQLSGLIDGFLGSAGTLSAQTDGLNSSIKQIGKQQTAVNDRLAAMEKRYRAQFTALDTMLASLGNTSNYLSQQLAQLSSLSNQ